MTTPRRLWLLALGWVLLTPLYGQTVDCSPRPCPPPNTPCMRVPPNEVNGQCPQSFVGDGQPCNGPISGTEYRCFDTDKFPEPLAERYQCLPLVCLPGVCNDENNCTDDICYNTPGGATCDSEPTEGEFVECSIGFDPGVCIKDGQGGVQCDTTDPCLRPGYGRLNCCEESACGLNWASTCLDPLPEGSECDPTGVEPPSTDGTPQLGHCVNITGSSQCVWDFGAPGAGLCDGVVCDDEGNDCTRNACNPATGQCETSAIPEYPFCDGTTETKCQPNTACLRTNSDCADTENETFTDSQCCSDIDDIRFCPGGPGTCLSEALEGENCSPVVDGTLSSAPGECAVTQLPLSQFFASECIATKCAVPDPSDPDGDGLMPKDCNDGSDCTVDECDPFTGECTHTLVEDFSFCDNRGGLCFAAGTATSLCLPFAEPVVHTCDLAGVLEAVQGLGVRHTFDCSGPTTVTLAGNISLADGVELDGGGLLTIEGSPGPGTDNVRSALEGFSAIRDLDFVGVRIVNEGSLVLERITLTAGGGIDNGTGESLELIDSTVTGNLGNSTGGGLSNSGAATVRNTTISGNGANFGGGIYSVGELVMEDSIVSGNTAFNLGGGAYIALPGGGFGDSSIAGTTITDNDAGDAGGGIFVVGSGAAVEDPRFIALADTTVSLNTATNSGGGIHTTGDVTLSGSTSIESNTVSAGNGGGIFQTATATLSVVGASILDNNAIAGAGIYNEGDLVIANGTVANNDASAEGGGIRNDGTMNLSNATIRDNDAQFGAGVYQSDVGSMNAATCVFRRNDAQNDGGGVYAGGDVTIADTTIADNSAGDFGGGVYFPMQGGADRISSSTLSNNGAGSRGGAIWISQGGNTVDLVNTTVADNVAVAVGGIRVGFGSQLMMISTTIANNATLENPRTDDLEVAGTVVARNSIVDGECAIFGAAMSLGGNVDLVADPCGFSEPTDQTVLDARLLPLANRGGNTETMGPEANSPAIDTIDGAECVDADGAALLVDQIGTARPQDTFCDSGAVERIAP
ncbi:MAG: right-handed parallel beta-helix repeat-containing protein [Myxococcota bacterium]